LASQNKKIVNRARKEKDGLKKKQQRQQKKKAGVDDDECACERHTSYTKMLLDYSTS